jgi:hypothetical protein
MQPPALGDTGQGFTGSQQVLLADEVGQRSGPQALGQRRAELIRQ